MTKVVRFFHIRMPHTTHGGATVQVTGDTDVVGQVDVQFTQCSKKDQFVKKEGRSFAAKAPVKILPLRYLPQELGRIAGRVNPYMAQNVDYTFAMKYFLPKE